MGIPLLKDMNGDDSGTLMVQIIMLQCIIWYTLMVFLFECRGARMLIGEQFLEMAHSIISFKVDSDMLSLDGKEPLETQAKVGEDGKLHATVCKSMSSRSEVYSRKSNNRHSGLSLTPRASNLIIVEIYSLQSSRNTTPRGSSFNHTDYEMSFDEESRVRACPPNSTCSAPPNAGIFSLVASDAVKKKAVGGGKDLDMYVWSSSSSPVSEGGIHMFRGDANYGNDIFEIGAHPKGSSC